VSSSGNYSHIDALYRQLAVPGRRKEERVVPPTAGAARVLALARSTSSVLQEAMRLLPRST
jgi:hypothetical protein